MSRARYYLIVVVIVFVMMATSVYYVAQQEDITYEETVEEGKEYVYYNDAATTPLLADVNLTIVLDNATDSNAWMVLVNFENGVGLDSTGGVEVYAVNWSYVIQNDTKTFIDRNFSLDIDLGSENGTTNYTYQLTVYNKGYDENFTMSVKKSIKSKYVGFFVASIDYTHPTEYHILCQSGNLKVWVNVMVTDGPYD